MSKGASRGVSRGVSRGGSAVSSRTLKSAGDGGTDARLFACSFWLSTPASFLLLTAQGRCRFQRCWVFRAFRTPSHRPVGCRAAAAEARLQAETASWAAKLQASEALWAQRVQAAAELAGARMDIRVCITIWNGWACTRAVFKQLVPDPPQHTGSASPSPARTAHALPQRVPTQYSFGCLLEL